LKKKVVVDFMGDVDYFLGTAFTWKRHPDNHLSVHLCQSPFTEFTAHRFGIDKYNRTPNMTPYRSGLPIDSIASANPKDPDLKRCTKVYQAIIGSINWLATCRPDVSPVLSFLASYSTSPSYGHYQAALYALKYLYSTSDYGISFHSDASNTIQAFNNFPHHHDKEAYSDATPPPAPGDCFNLTAFTRAGVANMEMQSKMVLPLNSLNIVACPVFSSAGQGGLLLGNQSVKIKQLSVHVKQKSSPPTNVPWNSKASAFARKTSAWPPPTNAPLFTTTIKPPSIGLHRAPTKAQNTSTSAKIMSTNTPKWHNKIYSHSWRHQRQLSFYQGTQGHSPFPPLPRFVHGLEGKF
jgi:hypothetical protein